MLRHLLILLLIFSKSALAQNQADNWYFGDRAGLNFKTCTPTILTDGQINTNEGVATISDANGDLLFYTDGITIWNKVHAIMQNGTGLAGDPSSTQSAVIVPMPGSNYIYYVFTPAVENTNGGLRFSIIDMAANGGLGTVTEKNTLLANGINEKVTAVRHANNIDFWVISRVFNSLEYRSWQLSSTGISAAVVSLSSYNPGADHNKSRGYLKPSVDGDMLFCVFDENDFSEIARFNKQTGQVYSVIKFKNIPAYLITNAQDRSGAYGVEFSPNGKFMYVSASVTNRNFYLSQYNVSVFDSATILNSATLIDSGFSALNSLGSEYWALQLAKNGKIYIARLNSYYLSVINEPNLPGSQCNLILNGQHLNSRRSRVGLPTFMQTYLNPNFRNYDFTFTQNCNKNLSFNLSTTDIYDSLRWDFGDPGSGLQNSAIITTPIHQYTSNGSKMVKLIVYNFLGCRVQADTIIKQVNVGITPPSLGPDTTICEGQLIILNAKVNGANSYLWNSGADTETIQVSLPGLYWCEVTIGACKIRDSIRIYNKPYPIVNLGNDFEMCRGNAVILNAFNSGANYVWQDGSTQSEFNVTNAGIYYVSANLNGCIKKDSVNVSVLNKPLFTLGADRTICNNETIQLQPLTDPDWTLLWNTGSAASSININATGTYSLQATNRCGSTSDAIVVSKGICDIYVPSAFTPNNDGINDVFKILGANDLEHFYLCIYNRYGQKIFESKNSNIGWNGLYKQHSSEAGSYIYQLNYKKTGSSKSENLKGNFLLLR